MGNKIIIGLAVALLLFFGVFKVLSLPKQPIIYPTPNVVNSPQTNTQISPPPSPIMPGQSITVRGEVVCLPSKNNSGITTMGCAIGLKTESGTYWGLNNIQNELVSGKFTNGDQIEVTGTQNNDIINVTSAKVIKKGATPQVLGVSTGQLDLTASVTEPISSTPYVKVYVKRFTLPSSVNITKTSGNITLTSGLPYIAQGAFAIWYSPSGNCPEDGSVYRDYKEIQAIPGATTLIWLNTILSKPGTIQVPTNFHFPVKRSMRGCGFLTFDMASSPNAKPTSAGLTLQSNVILHYDTDSAVPPQPYMVPFGGEICFGASSGCEARTTCTNNDCAYIFTTQVNSPTYLLSLFGDVNTGALSQPYADPPTGTWESSVDIYIYPNCSAPQPGRNIAGPADYYNQIPTDAIHLLNVPMHSYNDEAVVISVDKVYPTPILLKPGNCLVSLTKFSSSNGGATVNNAMYGLAQLAPFGSLDQANCTEMSGWAGNRNVNYSSDSPVEVHFYADGVGPTHFLGKATANTATTKAVCNLLNSSQSPCQHGYTFNTPNSLKDGKPHTIDVYAIDNIQNLKLPGSGKTITCSATKSGDLNNDGNVDLYDYNLLVSNFGNPYTIFDYNLLVANYGKNF